jgi:heme-degrading monooxygenase HmoA
MHAHRNGQIAVIFTSLRTGEDAAGYAAAALAMAALAAEQPGFCGFDGARGNDGFGVTISYWEDEAAAVAWRGHAEHALIRQVGRDRWYSRYEVMVARVERSYAWVAGEGAIDPSEGPHPPIADG